MRTFVYPFFSKVIYKFGNIPLTLILLLHLFFSIFMAIQLPLYWFSSLLNLIIIFVINKYYIKIYKYFPFKIQINNEKMICSNFFLSSSSIEFLLSDIDEIKGGMFSGHLTKPIYIFCGAKNIKIGLFQHVKDLNQVIKIILENINDTLYQSLLDKMKDYNITINPKRKRSENLILFDKEKKEG